MRYPNLEEAIRQHAGIPLDRWVEKSGREVLSMPVGAVKRCCWDSVIDKQTLQPIEHRLTYWAAHTDLGLKSGVAHTRRAAARQANAAISRDRRTMQEEDECCAGMRP